MVVVVVVPPGVGRTWRAVVGLYSPAGMVFVRVERVRRSDGSHRYPDANLREEEALSGPWPLTRLVLGGCQLNGDG